MNTKIYRCGCMEIRPHEWVLCKEHLNIHIVQLERDGVKKYVYDYSLKQKSLKHNGIRIEI